MESFNEHDIVKFITGTHYVYGLINPLNNKLFYIGKGYKLRLFDHKKQFNYKTTIVNNKHLLNTIKQILKANLSVRYVIFFNSENQNLTYYKEIEFIKKVKIILIIKNCLKKYV